MAGMTTLNVARSVRIAPTSTHATPTSMRLGVSAPLPCKLNGMSLALPMRRRTPVSRAHVVVRASVNPSTMTDAAQAIYTIAAEVAAEPEAKSGGFLSPVVNALEAILKVLDSGLEGAGIPYSYGFSIILLTLLVKLATFPLSKKQVESTLAMQTLQPQIKDLQKKFAYDKERLQMETARLYQDAGVNPLAGCLPTLATLPVWIGLYRALSNVADEGLLTEGFFWIPSLAGPTALASRDAGSGLSWLLPLQDGAPPIGWDTALAYLVMPVLLTASQFISQAIISPTPKDQDETQASTNAILKFLPLMIGWFSLNVPSGLTLYWFTNNILTTAQQVYLRGQPVLATAGGDSGGVDIPASSAVIDVVSEVDGGAAPLTRRERRDVDRKEKRGKRFEERKAAEAASKTPESESSDNSA